MKKPITRNAEGVKSVSSAWQEAPVKVTADTVPSLQNNIHYRDAVSNLMIQVFPAPPEIWVTDAEGDTDAALTAELRADFNRLSCYELMQQVLSDVYGWGAFLYSVGTEINGASVRIAEIRHLPPASFRVPHLSEDYIITNPLLPGVGVNGSGEVEVWQTGMKLQQTLLHNVSIVRLPGTPYPAGWAYMHPVYSVVSMIEFATKAQLQQLNRVGAPILLPKVHDEADEESYRALRVWAKDFTRSWGKDTVGLIPPGIEFPSLNFEEGTCTQDALTQWVSWIHTFTNPMSSMMQTGNLGASDTGRMEMWTNFIASRQELCEGWLEKEFDAVLAANGYDGFSAHIQLRRPSVDRAEVRLSYLHEAAAVGAVTVSEIRDNMTDILELQETTPDLLAELEESA